MRAFFGGQAFFGQVWQNPGKIPSHPQKFACSYTYGWHHPKPGSQTQVAPMAK